MYDFKPFRGRPCLFEIILDIFVSMYYITNINIGLFISFIGIFLFFFHELCSTVVITLRRLLSGRRKGEKSGKAQ